MNKNVILHPKGHMLLATKQVETLKTFLPTMNIFPTPMPNGDWLCAIPHRWDEFQVLRNLGIEGPSLLTNWKYTGRFTPRSYQRETCDVMVHNRVSFVFDETGCLDSETEYLSPTGWRKISEYDGGEVTQYDVDTGEASFVQPLEYIKKPCDFMLRIKTTRGVDQKLSAEHRVLYASPEGRPQVRSALEVYEMHKASKKGFSGRILSAFKGAGGKGVDLTDDELRLQVAIQADGHFAQHKLHRQCILRLKKHRKIERLRHLLDATSWEFRERFESSTGFTIFILKPPLQQKRYDAWAWDCSAAQLNVIVDEVAHWDGSFLRNGSRSFYTSAKGDADFIQYAASAIGLTASLSTYYRERQDRADSIEHVVHILNRHALRYVKGNANGGKSETMWWEPSTDGFKYCFSVPKTFLVIRRGGYVSITGNTGKTSSSIWAAEYLFQQDKIDAVLVLSTLSSLEPTWANEIWNTAPHRSSVVIHDNNPDMKVKLAQQDVHFYIMNHDGFKLDYINDIFMKSKKRWMVIVDEATKFKSRKSDRHKALARFFRKHDPIRVAMTATPMPNGPDDAYGLAMLMYPNGAKMSYMQFKDATQFKISNFKWVNKKGWEQVAHSLLQPAVLHRKRDYLHELPPITYEDYYVPMSPSIRKAYDAVFSDFVYAEGDADGSRSVTAINAAAKRMKLRQISCGSVYDDEREILTLDTSAKDAVLLDIFEKTPGKLLVAVPFVAAVHRVAEFFEKHGKRVGIIHGGVSKGERDRIFKEMQRGELDVIVGQPGSMAHSVTLTEASDIVWYGPVEDAEIFEQFNGRIERLGQQNPMTVHCLYSNNMERKVYDLLKTKQADQKSLLDLYLEEAKERR